MQKKNLIALVIMVLLLMVITPIAFKSIPEIPYCKHLEGRVDELPAAIQGSIAIYYHYYGWEDGLSVLLIDHVSGKQVKPGEQTNQWGVSGSSSVRGNAGGLPWLRNYYGRSVQHTISVSVRSSEEMRDVEFTFDHQFNSGDPLLANLTIEGSDYEVTSDTVFFIDHELDGSVMVNQLDIDLSDLLGESESGFPRMRGVPTEDGIEAYLLQSSSIEELLHAGNQEQK